MSKQLTNELSKGTKAARALAAHLNQMGAGRATIPVKFKGEKFTIVITRSRRAVK